MKVFCFGSLFVFFFLLFQRDVTAKQLADWGRKRKSHMEALARARSAKERKQLAELQEENSLLRNLEKQLRFSGLKLRFPHLTAEWWIVGNLAGMGAVFLGMLPVLGIFGAVGICSGLLGAEVIWLRRLRLKNLRRVNEGLLKLLDFLGNYSVTSGELTGVLEQVSRYMDEPIRGALEGCCLEARTTGDISMALLTMGESVEHPKFQELARNMEISIRYCADFSAMVSSSRRSMREYLRMVQERKGMLREAWINMVILLGMSGAVLGIASSLIGQTVPELLFETVPGKAASGLIAVILLLFAGQARKIQM